MRSETLTPLLQFVNWIGLDPWRFAGIDHDNVTASCKTGTTAVEDNEGCYCILQSPWMSNHWSRDDIIAFLQEAERLFISEAGYYPAPYYIEGEQKRYPFGNNNSIYSASGIPKTVRPDFPCYLQDFGKYSLTLLDGAVVLDKSNLEEFTATFNVPAGTSVADIRIYFTASDGGYLSDPTFNEHLYEIRPVDVTIDALNVATLVAPSYLFKQPVLDELEECVCHVADSYVDEIAVFIITNDTCSQGEFVAYPYPCNEPCEFVYSDACINKRLVGKQIYGMFYSVSCNDNGDYVKYCLTNIPREVKMNYLTGVAVEGAGYMEHGHVATLSMLALGMADCVKGLSDWCCKNGCVNQKFEYYKTAPKALTELDQSSTTQDKKWELALTNTMLAALGGLPPANGVIQALRFINKNGCNSVEGSYL